MPFQAKNKMLNVTTCYCSGIQCYSKDCKFQECDLVQNMKLIHC